MSVSEHQALLDYYNRGLMKYKERKWGDAYTIFKELLLLYPQDGPSKLYLERCGYFMQNPPEDDWDGVFVMTTK